MQEKTCTIERKIFFFISFFLHSFFVRKKNLYIWLQLRIRNKECNLEFLLTPSFMFSSFSFIIYFASDNF
jgi:hypothetical protein